MAWPVFVFQNRMCLSAVPPPLAKTPDECGFQSMAFTAAVCSRNLYNGLVAPFSHTIKRLSLPPLASCVPLTFHFSPQT